MFHVHVCVLFHGVGALAASDWRDGADVGEKVCVCAWAGVACVGLCLLPPLCLTAKSSPLSLLVSAAFSLSRAVFSTLYEGVKWLLRDTCCDVLA